MQSLSRQLVYRVAHLFLEEDRSATEIANWLVEHYEDELRWLTDGMNYKKKVSSTQRKVYAIVRAACTRGFMRLIAPREEHIADCIRHRYRIDPDERQIEVVDVAGKGIEDATHAKHDRSGIHRHVVEASADVILKLIKDIAAKNAGERVRIGLGAGHTAMHIAQQLGMLSRSEPDMPPLGLHSLTATFSMDVTRDPDGFYRFFDSNKMDIEVVPLVSGPIVPCDDYAAEKSKPLIREAFDRADEIDIVITSFAAADHEHGLLNQFMGASSHGEVAHLKAQGWIGDVHFLPYSKDGPITLDTGDRAVTLFELDELVELANKDGKYVVLIAAPCYDCGKLKTQALLPLIESPKLRMWTHCVMDIETAQTLLPNAA